MTTSDVKLSEGTGSKIVACYAVTEDAETKQLQRIVHSDSAGNEIEPVTVGQDTMAASLPVVIASDQSAIPVTASLAAAQTLATVTTVGTVSTITNVVHVDDNSGSLTVDGTVAVSGTVTVGTHAVTIASGGVASGALASGSVASGAIASGAVASGAFASGSVSDGAVVTLGAKADAKSTATDTTSVSIMSVLKQISASIQTFVFGAGTAAAAQRVTLASDDPAVATLGATTGSKVITDANGTLQQYMRGIVSQSVNFCAGEYETVAASQTDQALGATGATGDYLEAVLIVPGTSAAGAVSIKDGSGSAISIFAGGGTTALADLAPIYVPLAMVSTGGAWKVTTGTNVTAIGIGNFT